jgi:hypothetical protein
VNLIKTPSIESDTTGYDVHDATMSQDGEQAKYGQYSLKVQTTNADAYVRHTRGDLEYLDADASTPYALSVWVYVDVPGDEVRLGWWEYDAQDNFLKRNAALQTLSQSGWQRLVVRLVTSADCAKIRPLLVDMDSGHTYYLDGWQLEQKAYQTSYSDGSLGVGYSWGLNGAYADASTRKPTGVSVSSSGNLSTDEGTILIWFKDLGRSVEWGRLFDYVIDTDNRMRIQRSSGGKVVNVEVRSEGANVGLATDEITADEWHLLCVTYSKSEDAMRLYFDGELKSSGVYPAPVGSADKFYIGSADGSSYFYNCEIAELALFDRILTAGEVASLYTIGMPASE